MNAREKAYELLCEIVLKKKYSNLALRHGINDFSALDRSLIVSIVLSGISFLKWSMIVPSTSKNIYFINFQKDDTTKI